MRDAAEEWAEARQILYVPGSHECYGTDIDRGRKQLAEECYNLGITLLAPDAIVIDDVPFIAATLWTDFLLDGLADEPGAHRAGLGLSDIDGWIGQEQGTGRFATYESVRSATSGSARSSRMRSPTRSVRARPRW